MLLKDTYHERDHNNRISVGTNLSKNQLDDKEEKCKYADENENDNYFLSNKLNMNVFKKREDIIFEKEIDKEKIETEKVFLFDMSAEQKEETEKLKVDKIIQNEIYLKNHKILKYIIQIFLADLLKEKPENVYDYAATYFTQSNLKQYILQQLKLIVKK